MDLTPQSSRSPGSPSHISSTSQVYEYPSPALSQSRYNGSSESLQGLGLYSCQMLSTSSVDGNTLAHLQSSPAAPWQPTSPQHRGSPPSSTAAEYTSFGPLHPTVPSSYGHDIYGAQTAEVSVLPASPLPSGATSHRSSFSSRPPSEVFSRAGSLQSNTPRIKMEDFTDYAPGSAPMTYGSPEPAYSLLPSAHSFAGALESTYFPEQSGLGWPKVEYGTSSELNSPYSNQGYESRSGNEDHGSSSSQPRRGSNTLIRTRQPRKLTTKEDANFQCQVKGCGKLFGRSYNYKAHMETHDASREYPFPCQVKDCTKKFVRKTDLQRHHQSVHMKQRNYKCDYCGRFFARKDTLRRHMEDGCSKRFDIETVDFRPQDFSHGEQHTLRSNDHLGDEPPRLTSYNATRYTPSPVSSSHQGTYDPALSSSITGPYYGTGSRPQYVPAGVNVHEGIWSN